MADVVARAVCYRCHKPKAMCLCAQIPRVDNRTGVFVLQHPRERLHSIGTARLARLGLAKVHVEIAWNAGAEETETPSWLPEDAALLYPSPDAQDLHALPARARPKNLLVIDGTWHTARTLYRDKRWLARLPHYRFSPATPSRYRLRREPHRDFVSTIEAIVEALRLLEPDTRGLDRLLQAFDAMIDAQLAHIGKQTGVPRTRKKRPAEQRRTPRVLVDELARVVVAYAESWRAQLDTPRELVHVCAVALHGGQLFERVITPQSGVPAPLFLAHMRLEQGDFASACTPEQFVDDWQAFLTGIAPLPLLAAWNQSSLDLIAAAIGGKPSQLSLKAAYRAVHGANARDLDAVIEKLALGPSPLPIRGRAARRLPNAVSVARYLNARAHTEVPQR